MLQRSPYHLPVVLSYLVPVDVHTSQSGVDGVDCIYAINLDHRTDKWERLVKLFKKHKIHANQMSAVNGKLLHTRDMLALFGPNLIVLSKGEVGCLLSHLSVVRDAYVRKFKHIWIMEDDVEFVEGIIPIEKAIKDLAHIDPKWDILYTDTNFRDSGDGYIKCEGIIPRPGQKVPAEHILFRRSPMGNNLERLRLRYGTASMILSRSGIMKILSYYSKVFLWGAYDWDLHLIPGLRQYGLTRDVVTNVRSGLSSDIRRAI